MSGLQSILQESCTTSIWLNPEIVWAKYFAKAKACGRPNSFGQVNGSQNNFKELCKGSCQGHPIFLVPICFVRATAGWHPECFGQVDGLQSIIQESDTISFWLTQKNVRAKYSAKAKACVPPNLFG